MYDESELRSSPLLGIFMPKLRRIHLDERIEGHAFQCDIDILRCSHLPRFLEVFNVLSCQRS